MPPPRIVADLAAADACRQVPGLPHSIAEIVGHLRFWQDWFLLRCRGTAAPMVERASEGWPAVAAADWPGVLAAFLSGLEAAAALGDDPAALDRPVTPALEFPPLAGYTVGDALTHVAAHNAHHLGQVVTLRQLIGRWPPPQGAWTWG